MVFSLWTFLSSPNSYALGFIWTCCGLWFAVQGARLPQGWKAFSSVIFTEVNYPLHHVLCYVNLLRMCLCWSVSLLVCNVGCLLSMHLHLVRTLIWLALNVGGWMPVRCATLGEDSGVWLRWLSGQYKCPQVHSCYAFETNLIVSENRFVNLTEG